MRKEKLAKRNRTVEYVWLRCFYKLLSKRHYQSYSDCEFPFENGVKVWIDKDGSESGDAFKSVIVSAIDNASTFLFFSSAASNESEWTVKEVNTAIYKKKRIIPIKLDNSDYSPSILFDLVGLEYIDFTRVNKTDGMLQRLLKSLGKSQSIQPES